MKLNRRVLRRIANFEFFFNFLDNSLYFKHNLEWRCVFIPAVTHVYIGKISVSGTNNLFVLKFLKKNLFFWQFFWKLIAFQSHNATGFFAELELIGLGFRVRKINDSVYRFFWGYANYIYLFASPSILVEYAPDDRLIFFFSTNPNILSGVISHLVLLKKLSKYRVTGFIKPGTVIRLNSGKQR